MLPRKRHRILAYVGHKNTLPPGTNIAEINELENLIRRIDYPRWQLTSAGWRELERLGRSALAG